MPVSHSSKDLTREVRQLIQQPWFKHAAAVADDKEVERQFADQAFTVISNKAGPLMKDPYRMGFEVVWRNDNATRLVGIFAFRVGEQMYYAPVFFLHGEIRGSDLLYQVARKKFIPLDDAWVQFIIARDNVKPLGKGQPTSVTRQILPQMQLNRLAMPPSMQGSYGQNKYAGGRDDPAYNAAWAEFLDSMNATDKEIARFKEAGAPLLVEYLAQAGGRQMNKLANLIEKHARFADVICNGPFDLAELPVQFLPEEPVVKQAAEETPAAPKQPELRIYRDILQKEKPDAEFLTKFASSGSYLVEDDRDPEACSLVGYISPEAVKNASEAIPMVEGKDLPVVEAGRSGELTMLSTPGKYELITADLEPKPGILLLRDDRSPATNTYGGESCGCPIGRDERKDVLVRWEDGSITQVVLPRQHSADNMDTPMGYLAEELDYTKAPFSKTPTSGKCYWPVLTSKHTALGYRAVRVVGSKSRGAVKIYEVTQYSTSEPDTITINPDLEVSDMGGRVFGSDLVWMEVSERPGKNEDDCCDRGMSKPKHRGCTVKPGMTLVTQKLMTAFILRQPGAMKVGIKKDPNKTGYKISGKDKHITLEKTAAVKFLAGALGIHGDTAVIMLKDARSAGRNGVEYSVVGQEGFDVEKNAAAFISMTQQPVWRERQEPDFGLTVREPERYALRTQQYAPAAPAPRIGDAWDPTLGTGTGNSDSAPQEDMTNNGISTEELMRLSPDQLMNLQTTRNAPSVFDAGAVATLIHTEDAMGYVDKFYPKLVDALDALGRIQFLIYWKPKEFENAFGTDDMQTLENDLLSNWKSFGRLVLNLLKRSRTAQDRQFRPEEPNEDSSVS